MRTKKILGNLLFICCLIGGSTKLLATTSFIKSDELTTHHEEEQLADSQLVVVGEFSKFIHRINQGSLFQEKDENRSLYSLLSLVTGIATYAFAALFFIIAQSVITLSGLWIVIGGLLAIAAVILGILGLREVKSTGRKGRGMAIVGLTLGGVYLAYFLAAIIGIALFL